MTNPNIDEFLAQLDRDTASAGALRVALEAVLADSPAVLTVCDVQDGHARIRIHVPADEHDEVGNTPYLLDAFQWLINAGHSPNDLGCEEVQDGRGNARWIHTWTAEV